MKKSITELLNDAALAGGGKKNQADQLTEIAIDELAANGTPLEISKSANADIERMVSGMILLPEVCAILLGQFIDLTIDKGRSYREKLEKAKRKGTMPRVEILVYGNEVMN